MHPFYRKADLYNKSIYLLNLLEQVVCLCCGYIDACSLTRLPQLLLYSAASLETF